MRLFLKSRRKAVNPLKKLKFEVQLNVSTAHSPRSTAESWGDMAYCTKYHVLSTKYLRQAGEVPRYFLSRIHILLITTLYFVPGTWYN